MKTSANPMRSVAVLGAASLTLLAAGSLGVAVPPKVTLATPASGARDVDPAPSELRIEFDQPMSTAGHSLVGGGPTFPQFVGKPRWENDRTFVWSWRLEAGREYWLAINSERFTNFRNREGEAAIPHPVSFRTATRKEGSKDQPTSPADRVALNREAIGHLRRVIDEDYSYRDRLKVDWEGRFREASTALENATSARAFAELAVRLLEPAKDPHLWLEVDGQRLATFRRQAEWNVATVSLPRSVPGWMRRSRVVCTGYFQDGTRYIELRSWPGDADLDLKPAYEVLAEAAAAGQPLIIDVRANGGGDEPAAAKFAGCFVDKPVVYAKHITRRNRQFSEPRDRVLQPNASGPKYRGRIAVLMGPGTVSSCESFVLMMKQAPGCILVGGRTAGASGNPKPVNLGNGVTAFVPSWQDLRLDGTCFEAEGIAPDVEVRATPGELRQRDPIIEKALILLREPAQSQTNSPNRSP